MSQTGKCHRCGAVVVTHEVDRDRAYFKCECGKRWSTRAFHGYDVEEDKGGHGGLGALIGLGFGGLEGAVLGGIVGSLFRKKQNITSTCLVCGGTGKPTGFGKNIVMFQCERCLRTWTERR